MGNGTNDPKQHAHELIDRMAPGQVSAVVPLLEIILDPFARTLAGAPYDDEPVSAEEAREVEEAKASLARGEGVAREEVLAEVGLTSEDFERMGRTPVGRTAQTSSKWLRKSFGAREPRPTCAPSTKLRPSAFVTRFLLGNEGDVKRLRDIEPPEFRLRVLDYGVRFHDFGDAIEILSVKHRREAYR